MIYIALVPVALTADALRTTATVLDNTATALSLIVRIYA